MIELDKNMMNENNMDGYEKIEQRLQTLGAKISRKNPVS